MSTKTNVEVIAAALAALCIPVMASAAPFAAGPAHADEQQIGTSLMQVSDIQREAGRPRLHAKELRRVAGGAYAQSTGYINAKAFAQSRGYAQGGESSQKSCTYIGGNAPVGTCW
jgi:hypothetical protein